MSLKVKFIKIQNENDIQIISITQIHFLFIHLHFGIPEKSQSLFLNILNYFTLF